MTYNPRYFAAFSPIVLLLIGMAAYLYYFPSTPNPFADYLDQLRQDMPENARCQEYAAPYQMLSACVLQSPEGTITYTFQSSEPVAICFWGTPHATINNFVGWYSAPIHVGSTRGEISHTFSLGIPLFTAYTESDTVDAPVTYAIWTRSAQGDLDSLPLCQ